ncbi:hypothetical protein [Ferrimonas sediminicola]|nr:hypothetical protein [Ferrimonas sediminicola]
MQQLPAYENEIERLSLASNPELRFVNLRHNRIQEFDVSHNGALETLLL